MMKKLPQLILGAGLALASIAVSKAQTFPVIWPYAPYAPGGIQNWESYRWASYTSSERPTLTLKNGIWGPYNACSISKNNNGWHYPLRIWTKRYDNELRHWSVEYDIIADTMSGYNPYYADGQNYSYTKGFPNILLIPNSYWVSQAGWRRIMSTWYLGCDSNDWANNRFNAIYEIRVSQYNSDGTQKDKTQYILQLEMLQSKLGTHLPANFSAGGVAWTTGGRLSSAEGWPVYKFVASGASVNANAVRNFQNINLAPLLAHTAANRDYYDRASTAARVYEVHAGVEIGLGSYGNGGTPSKVWTGDYYCTVD